MPCAGRFSRYRTNASGRDVRISCTMPKRTRRKAASMSVVLRPQSRQVYVFAARAHRPRERARRAGLPGQCSPAARLSSFALPHKTTGCFHPAHRKAASPAGRFRPSTHRTAKKRLRNNKRRRSPAPRTVCQAHCFCPARSRCTGRKPRESAVRVRILSHVRLSAVPGTAVQKTLRACILSASSAALSAPARGLTVRGRGTA